MVGSNAALLEHTKEEYNKAKDDEELIKGIYHLNDGEYLEMPDDVEALVWMIKIQQRWDLFVKVLESLQYYPYQGCIIHYVRTVEECASIINQLHGCQHEKVLRHLMRERVFSLLQNEETSLKTNAEGGLQERWVSTATELYDKWKKTKDGILKDFAKEQEVKGSCVPFSDATFLIGANNAEKTTTLYAIDRLLGIKRIFWKDDMSKYYDENNDAIITSNKSSLLC